MPNDLKVKEFVDSNAQRFVISSWTVKLRKKYVKVIPGDLREVESFPVYQHQNDPFQFDFDQQFITECLMEQTWKWLVKQFADEIMIAIKSTR